MYDFEKYVHSSLKAISNLGKEKAFHAKLEGFTIDNSIATSIKNPKGGYTIKFFLDKEYDRSFFENYKSWTSKSILLYMSESIYSINANSATQWACSLNVPRILTIEVNNFQSAENEKFNNKVLRLIIPTEDEVSFDAFQCKRLKVSDTFYLGGLIETMVDDKSYHIFKHKNDDTNGKYIIIDSVEENSFEEFKVNTSAILLSFGLITGNLYQNEYYYQTFRTDNFTIVDETAYVKKEASIISNANIFNPNEFIQYFTHLKRQDELENIPLYLQKEGFSTICQRIKDNDTFARCLTLLLEGNQTKFLLLRAGIYSIALETLTNIIYEENKDKLNPIPDKVLAEKIMTRLHKEINEYSSSLSEDGLKILNAKINEINRPTNSKKLSMPFEFYEIPLSKTDIGILNYRNKFLHGTSPFEEEELKDKLEDVNYISLKLQYLINCLVLKYCNYKGHIVNFGSWHQYNLKGCIKEPLFSVI
jgi:hypothetical protein